MPYLQLDTAFSYSPEQKQRLAKRLGEIYSRTMRSNINRLTVAIRELGAGNIWRCGEGDPRPAALLMCDIRRGRPPELRAEVARELRQTALRARDAAQMLRASRCEARWDHQVLGMAFLP
jgi:phenylpyruvate tautomerase PptA (4-oxalocrotonate tautomerase family)